jgi:predicted nucleic acid-binding protein
MAVSKAARRGEGTFSKSWRGRGVPAQRAGAVLWGELAAKVRKAFDSPQIELISFTPEKADTYARIRAEYRVSPADAIHLACASNAGVDLFLTNDNRLRSLAVPGIHFVAGMDVNLF